VGGQKLRNYAMTSGHNYLICKRFKFVSTGRSSYMTES